MCGDEMSFSRDMAFGIDDFVRAIFYVDVSQCKKCSMKSHNFCSRFCLKIYSCKH